MTNTRVVFLLHNELNHLLLPLPQPSSSVPRTAMSQTLTKKLFLKNTADSSTFIVVKSPSTSARIKDTSATYSIGISRIARKHLNKIIGSRAPLTFIFTDGSFIIQEPDLFSSPPSSPSSASQQLNQQPLQSQQLKTNRDNMTYQEQPSQLQHQKTSLNNHFPPQQQLVESSHQQRNNGHLLTKLAITTSKSSSSPTTNKLSSYQQQNRALHLLVQTYKMKNHEQSLAYRKLQTELTPLQSSLQTLSTENEQLSSRILQLEKQLSLSRQHSEDYKIFMTNNPNTDSDDDTYVTRVIHEGENKTTTVLSQLFKNNAQIQKFVSDQNNLILSLLLQQLDPTHSLSSLYQSCQDDTNYTPLKQPIMVRSSSSPANHSHRNNNDIHQSLCDTANNDSMKNVKNSHISPQLLIATNDSSFSNVSNDISSSSSSSSLSFDNIAAIPVMKNHLSHNLSTYFITPQQTKEIDRSTTVSGATTTMAMAMEMIVTSTPTITNTVMTMNNLYNIKTTDNPSIEVTTPPLSIISCPSSTSTTTNTTIISNDTISNNNSKVNNNRPKLGRHETLYEIMRLSIRPQLKRFKKNNPECNHCKTSNEADELSVDHIYPSSFAVVKNNFLLQQFPQHTQGIPPKDWDTFELGNLLKDNPTIIKMWRRFHASATIGTLRVLCRSCHNLVENNILDANSINLDDSYCISSIIAHEQ